VGGALKEVHCLPREVLWKRDHHHISTKFWLKSNKVSPQTFQVALVFGIRKNFCSSGKNL